jgi:signal transduction histidine kinase
VAVALPVAIIWLSLLAQAAGLLDSIELGGAMAAVVMIVSMAGILLWYAGVLDRMDVARLGDTAQIRRLNASLASRVIALEATTKEFQGFSYSMSHVLRAPLRAINGYAQIVLDDSGERLGAEGRRLLGVIHPDDLAIVVTAYERSAMQGQDFDERFRIVLPDGTIRWISDRARMTLDEEGRPRYLTGEWGTFETHLEAAIAASIGVLEAVETVIDATTSDVHAARANLASRLPRGTIDPAGEMVDLDVPFRVSLRQ